MSKTFLTEAFKKLDVLDEDTFEINDTGIKSLSDFQANDEIDDTVSIIDPSAETDEDISDSYVGKVILDCEVCHSKIYKDPQDVIVSDDEELVNIDEECPFCYSTDGFKVVGQVAEYNKDAVIDDDSADDDKTDTDIDKDDADIEVEDDVDEAVKPKKNRHISKITEDTKVQIDYTDGKDTVTFSGATEQEAEANARKQLAAKPAFKKSTTRKIDGNTVTESFEHVEIETADQRMSMSSDDSGKVTVETEPKTTDNKASDEVIAPVDDTVKSEIEDNSVEDDEATDDEYVDVDFDDFDNESFDYLGESYLKSVYSNVDSYKTTDVSATDTALKLEGMIKFSSGKTKKTSFIFEAKDATKKGKVKLIGENAQITGGKKAFTITGSVANKKFMTESFNYNYRTKGTDGKLNRLYGTIKK